ncbi:Asp/Glu/hydantoin racemase [Halteromyces radiatus]|uniref:Asp/Glu/hydantoin racemase n=1 Tax=Halteromyces radiatus TaxID=101107 RepID=UPI00222124A4|nr:Asp/Glu/hydantoin racemase [Halteromyces radiatus]KAI8082702.1 Asp/Glu/hydantoin racemase [Halteromyces radiatus]
MTKAKRLLVINPNTSKEMTLVIQQSVDDSIKKLGGLMEATTTSADQGVASVEGSFDEAVSTYWTVDKVMTLLDEYDGVLIACFSHHISVKVLREATSKPVMHIMEAAILQSLPLGAKFSIVTDSAHWKPLLEEGIQSILGSMERCASVRSSGMTALDTVTLSVDQVMNKLLEASQLAIKEDGAEVILLGCAGMSQLKKDIEINLGVPVIDAVSAGVMSMVGLLLSNLFTSPCGMYTPLPSRPDEVSVPNQGIMMAYHSGAK